jgi:Putative MetA-pathway of phenol degradation
MKATVVILTLVAGVAVHVGRAGPPFVTDDPEPAEYQHWEFYLASQIEHESGEWSGTSPHVEINYGALPNVHLHLIAPLAFNAPSHGGTQFGYGDTELGIKYRFIQETTRLPKVGVFPIVELPTGDASRGLGTGHAQVFLPLWLQKSFGPWTTYGGGGYWINPGTDNRNWWFVGWLVQRQLTSKWTLGAEVFHETAKEAGGESDTRFNVGTIFDFSDTYHLLLSAGHTLQGPSGFQAYGAFQITWGPKEEAASSKK